MLRFSSGSVRASTFADVTGVDDRGFEAELARKFASRCFEPKPGPVSTALAILDRSHVDPGVELCAHAFRESVDVVGMNVFVAGGADELLGAEAEEAFAVR